MNTGKRRANLMSSDADVIAVRPELRRASPTAASVAGLSIGAYLIRRLQDYGIRDVFGIPGDYVLAFYNLLEESPINVVGCTREDCAGFAADAYARINGLGVVCVTYCVGGLSLCNSIAGAYAEKSPVVVITGSPGMNERINNPLLHHRVRDFRTQLEVFEKICIAGAELSDPENAFREIDRVLDTAVRYKRPVYLELPRDMVNATPRVPHLYRQIEAASEPASLHAAVSEAVQWIASAQRPVIIAGVEMHRFNLQDEVTALAERGNLPIAATMLGKSVIRETHPLYIGLYEGAMGRQEVTRFVEESDCVILLGTFMTDINLGIFTATLSPEQCIYATSERLRIKQHHYQDVLLPDFIRALAARASELAVPASRERILPKSPAAKDYELDAPRPITIRRLIARLNEQLDDETIVIADIGDSLFAATELVTHERGEFLSPAYYTSMGFAIPASVGTQVARPDMRTVVIVGDGAFQMTGMELSTIARHNFPTVIILLDNKGYGTERVLHTGEHEYNDVHPWHYHKLPELLGRGRGYEVRTEGEFDAALSAAWAETTTFSIIQVHLGHDDCSQALQRLAEKLSKRVGGKHD
jgi:indolepyruvate decarboxylase